MGCAACESHWKRLRVILSPRCYKKAGIGLARRVTAGETLTYRGRHGEAEVSRGKERPQPLYQVGQHVHFFNLSTAYRIVGVGLYEDYRRLGTTMWAYFYANATGAGRPISEQQTSLATIAPAERTREGPGE